MHSRLNVVLAWFNLKLVRLNPERSNKRIYWACERQIKKQGEPWHMAPAPFDPTVTLPRHRQCPTVPTLPFVPAEEIAREAGI